MSLFSQVFDGSSNWREAKLPVIQAQQFLHILKIFTKQKKILKDMQNQTCCSEMWHETNNQLDGTIRRKTEFPENISDLIISGPHISTALPYARCPRRISRLSSDYDNVDLTNITEQYLPRTNYEIACSHNEYMNRLPRVNWGPEKYTETYRLCMRKMLNQDGERTLNAALLPKKAAHINGIFSLSLKDNILNFAAGMVSLPYDFYIKLTKKANSNFDAIKGLPILEGPGIEEAECRLLLLNCITNDFRDLWTYGFRQNFLNIQWSKKDHRLRPYLFSNLTSKWNGEAVLRTDYERRQALIEIDVLVSISMGLSLKELLIMYEIQFSTLKKNDEQTWFDTNGRIVFSVNTLLSGSCFNRSEWEKPYAVEPIRRGPGKWNGVMKDAPEGYVFARTITDDTMPGGPIERTIEYVAPFDRCDREKDYETAWAFFEKKYGGAK